MALLPIHIIAGLIGLVSGGIALTARKGARIHRKSGMVFVYAMLVMSASAALVASHKPESISMIAGMLTFYLVVTALLTVRTKASRRMGVCAMLFAIIVAILSITFAVMGLNSANGTLDGLPPAMGFIFGTVALLAALGDARMLMGSVIHWKHRIARHLWRMCFALWIAAGSFFLGQADEFPQALQIMPLLCTPILLVMLAMLYWLIRVLYTQWRPRFN